MIAVCRPLPGVVPDAIAGPTHMSFRDSESLDTRPHIITGPPATSSSNCDIWHDRVQWKTTPASKAVYRFGYFGRRVLASRNCDMAFASASVCPHCGRPKKSRWPIEIAAGAAVAIVGVISLGLWSGTHGDAPRETAPARVSETVIAHSYRMLERGLTASIGYNRSLHVLRIENRDTFTWTSCLLSLNSQGISSLKLEVDTIKAGLTEAVLLQSTEFVDNDGKKFDPTTSDVARLDLDCETPDGHRYYGGEFGPVRLHAR
jgi:hypothetical protein